MRKSLLGLFAAVLSLGGVAAIAAAEEVEIKGAHLCCGQCVKIAKGLLAKVEGVSDVNADQKSKTITFKAKDAAGAKAGVKAVLDGGFYGTITCDSKEHKVTLPGAEGKSDKVVVKDVHVCCGACKGAITKLFADSKIAYEGKGPQLTVVITGTGLDRAAVIESLRKAGFNGTVQK